MRPSFGTPAGPPAGTRTKFVTANGTVDAGPRSAPHRGETIDRLGSPDAGPRVTITATDAVTSGVRADPLFITNCKRIVCGPEGSGITRVFVLEVSANPPSTKTAAWPESGVDGPASGSVRLKFVTAKTIATGDPLPTIALFAGDTMERVGPGAARAFGTMRPDPPSNPIAAQTRMRAVRFTPTISRYGFSTRSLSPPRAACLRRRIRTTRMKARSSAIPPFETSGRLTAEDAATWIATLAAALGVSSLPSLFTRRAAIVMSPSGRETRRTGSYWTTSITTIPR